MTLTNGSMGNTTSIISDQLGRGKKNPISEQYINLVIW